MNDKAIFSQPFGTQILFYRKRRKLSQERLGNLVGLSNGYITKFEKGQKPPGFKVCEKIASVLALSEEEMVWFYKVATSERFMQTDKDFFDVVGTPNSPIGEKPKLIKGGVLLPILEYPTERILPPFNDKQAVRFDLFSDRVISENHYGVIYKDDYVNKEIDFKRGDLLIINPCFEQLNLGDSVLVRLGNKTTIRRYEVLSDKDRIYVHFLPYSSASSPTKYDPIVDRDKFDILGKVVYSFRQY